VHIRLPALLVSATVAVFRQSGNPFALVVAAHQAARVRGLSSDEALRGALRLAIKAATLESFLESLELPV
jgi:hypothetical protein